MELMRVEVRIGPRRTDVRVDSSDQDRRFGAQTVERIAGTFSGPLADLKALASDLSVPGRRICVRLRPTKDGRLRVRVEVREEQLTTVRTFRTVVEAMRFVKDRASTL